MAETIKTFDVPGHPGETITVPRQLTGRAYTLINQTWSRPRFVGWKDGGAPEYEPTINSVEAYWEALIQACTDFDASWNVKGRDKKLLSRTRETINGDKAHAEAFLTLAPQIYTFVMQPDDPSAEGNDGEPSATDEGDDSSKGSSPPKTKSKSSA